MWFLLNDMGLLGKAALLLALAGGLALFLLAPQLPGAWWARLLALVPGARVTGIAIARGQSTPLLAVAALLLSPVLLPAAAILVVPAWLAVALLPSLERCIPPHGAHDVDDWLLLSFERRQALEKWHEKHGVRGVARLLVVLRLFTQPAVKFWFAVASRIALAAAYVWLGISGSTAVPDAAAPIVLLWSVAALADELREVYEDRAMWLADRLNVPEFLGAGCTALGLVFPLVAPTLAGVKGDLLSLAAVLLLVSQGLRVLLRFERLGPLVGMLITMVERDLTQWVVLLTFGVLVPFPIGLWMLLQAAAADDDDNECAQELGASPWGAGWVLAKAVLGGGEEYLASAASPRPR